jgi:plasmid stabilization system protein ParE
MAQEVAWSAQAVDDLDAIAAYIGRDSPVHARRVVEEFFELSDSLARNPHIGRVVPELKQPEVRECFLYSYRLIYEVGRNVEILAVIHGRRLLLEAAGDRFDPN